ncbi:MAG: cyanophycin synthetase [Bacteroidetes bacterium HGW-Bacteroidetes-6]|jgi:cyanophycin synthetase|nr:MAG: cyanophycin synthetase [Bacteroidetes bacterium HGW-Bacteroidetes-6]
MSNEPIDNGTPEFQGRDLEAAKKLIEAVRKQFELENQQLEEYRKEMYDAKDFKASRFAFYDGPNYYLPCKAMVFNLFIAPVGDTVGFFRDEIAKEIPLIAESKAEFVIDLYAETLLQVMKMDIDLYINRFRIGSDADEYVVSIEYLDKDIAEECAFLVSDWFYAISHDKIFNFRQEWEKLQAAFDKTLFGGPTLYSLVEAGIKRNIPVFYLFEENQFQWGYGKKQLRGRSTTFHNDGIKDTEFTQFKDMCGDFLEMCGFPTPKGFNTFTVDDAVAAAEKIGYPCVIKPVNGHKGQGVTTGVMNEAEARVAFQNILTIGEIHEVPFQGALVQTQIYGTDHRLLAVNGKFAAALQRVPAFVEGDGEHNIKDLIAIENSKLIRLDNARSPLCKIKIDDDLLNYLALQHKSLNDIPEVGENITLRRVANISAGGVSYNVTDKIHPDNIRLVEDIASYLTIRDLGIDVLAADISKSWREGDFGIIEINAGPGVFMHLAPAYGGSIDVPGKIIMSHFGKPENSRIPIIATNGISTALAKRINESIHDIDKNAFFGYLLNDGVYFNGELFHNNPDHTQNEKMILRKPQVSAALFTETKDNIYDYGMLFEGADMVILDEPAPAEEDTLTEQLLPLSPLLVVKENTIELKIDNEVIESATFESPEQKDDILFSFIEKHLKDVVCRYNDIEKLHG